MVVVNLYAFEKIAAKQDAPVAELIENIDIGGPTMIRAAAKNYQDVAVVTSRGRLRCDPRRDASERRRALASAPTGTWRRRPSRSRPLTTAPFRRGWRASAWPKAPSPTNLPPRFPPCSMCARRARCRCATARIRTSRPRSTPTARRGIAGAEQLHGKELSYNNLVDLDAAWQLVSEFDAPAAAIIKHTNPCGCAEQATLAETYRKAFECDPVSAYGGVLAFNRRVDEETAREIAKTFVEAIAAPGYSPEALAVLTAKKNLRLLRRCQPRAGRTGGEVHQRRLPGADRGPAPARPRGVRRSRPIASPPKRSGGRCCSSGR